MADVAGSSTENHLNKVVLFGKTGCGKSTVANALVTGGIERVVFASSDGARGCTREIQEETGRGWSVVDTVGLGEAEEGTVSSSQARDKLTMFLKRVKNEYSHIIYVVKATRHTSMDELIWMIFTTIFEGAEDGFVILFTGANQNWLTEQWDFIPEYMKRYPILVTDIPPVKKGFLKRKNERTRRDAIPKLERELETLFRDRKYKYSIPGIAKMDDAQLERQSSSIIKRIVDFMKGLLGNSRENWVKAMKMFASLIDIAGFVLTMVAFSN